MKTSENNFDQLFYPVEHAIISKWLDIEPPAFARDINIYTNELPKGAIGLEPDISGQVSELALSNAIARIVLSTVQQELPQWVATRGDKIIYGRNVFDKHASKVSLLPQFLFEINWATSGPGFAWPVAYYVGYLPYYNVYVVTGSADSPEAFGYTDLALGHFPAEEDLLRGSERVITDDWASQYSEYEQHHWENLWRTGLLHSDRINRMADSVWGEDSQEEYREII